MTTIEIANGQWHTQSVKPRPFRWLSMTFNSKDRLGRANWIHRIHRIHRRQHASTDDAGMSKHRLSPYNAYYHNWQTLNVTTSDSSSDDRCFLKVLIVLHLTQLAGSKFQLSITLFENAYFLTFSLNLRQWHTELQIGGGRSFKVGQHE